MTTMIAAARPALARKENAQRDGLGAAEVSTKRTIISKSIAILPDCRSPVTETSRVSFAELAAMLATPRVGPRNGERVIGPEPPDISGTLVVVPPLTGWRCVLHTTYSHGGAILPEGIEHPRYRLIWGARK